MATTSKAQDELNLRFTFSSFNEQLNKTEKDLRQRNMSYSEKKNHMMEV